jgi:hypothetical protein
MASTALGSVLRWADVETFGTPSFRPYRAVLVGDDDELGTVGGAELGQGTWVRTVRTLRTSSSAISSLDLPWAARTVTSCSRGVHHDHDDVS